MQDLLTQTYYDNTLQSWLIAFAIMVFSAMLGKVAYWLFSKMARTLTRRSNSNLDDIIVDMVEEPAVFMIIASGFWFAVNSLTLPERFGEIVGNAYQVIIALLVGWLLSRLFDAMYKQYILPWAEGTENDLDDQLLPILSKGIKIVIWSMAFIIGMNNAGYDVAALLAGLGIGGLALAMAAKDTVSNVFGGFTIFTDQPFKIGDRIKVSGFDGSVTEIGVRSTRLKTLDGRIVTIPNSTFAESAVENVSWEPSRKVVLNLGLTYATTPAQIEQAMAILKSIADEHSGTEENTWMAFNAFGDFSLNICFIYYIIKGEDIGAVQTQINLDILRQFNEQGIEMAFPTQTLYNVKG